MSIKKSIFLLLIFASFQLALSAQNSLGFNVGLSSYEGDIHCFEEEDLNVFNSAGLSFGLQGKKEINNYLAARLAYQFAKINGDDNEFSKISGHTGRGFSFENNLHEITLRLDLEPWKKKVVSPFISVGAGVMFNNPNTFFDYDNKSTSLKSMIDQDRDELSRTVLALPISAGVNFRVSDLISLGAEFGIRYATSDYLDGVSMSASTNYNDYLGTGAITVNYTLGGTSMKSGLNTPTVEMKKATPDGQIKNEKPGSIKNEKREEAPKKVIDEREEIEFINSEIDEEEVIVEKVIDVKPATIDIKETTTHPGIDSDGDGIEDRMDTCPNIFAKTANGCPIVNKDIDTDGDGFTDRNDNCPRVYSKVNNGCPATSVNSDINCDAAFGKKSVNFQTSFAELSIKDKETLNSVIAIMTACPSMRLKLEGHTDSNGSNLTNQDLSDTRARSVKSYLIRSGIESIRVKASGYGETQAIADNGTASGRAKNRRVEIIFF